MTEVLSRVDPGPRTTSRCRSTMRWKAGRTSMASSTPPSDGVPRGVTQRQLTPPGPGTGRPTPLSRRLWVLLAVLTDLLIASLVLLAMALVSLSARRRGFGTLGLRRLGGGRVIGVVLGVTVVWSSPSCR